MTPIPRDSKQIRQRLEVGNEHLARAFHTGLSRARHPFVAVNCSSIPEGYRRAPGRSVPAQPLPAHSLLDEIGDAPLRVQLALLRVLETGC